MYFESRAATGCILAQELLDTYRYENCIVVALNDGGVQVGEQIAKALHCVLTLLLVEVIKLPGENFEIGAVSSDGDFTFNGMCSAGEIEEYVGEFKGYLEDQKRLAFDKLNKLLGDGGLMDGELIRDHVVILVADGISSTMPLDVAEDFLTPLRIQKLIIATPIASVPAVDRMHVLADELHILDVRENYLDTNHYYTDNDVPSHEDIVKKINEIILNWQ